jgi:hypothetical protein
MVEKHISVDQLLDYLNKNEKYLTLQINELVNGSDDDLSDISEEDAEELHELQGAIDAVCEIKNAIIGKEKGNTGKRLNPKTKLIISTNNSQTKPVEKKNRFAEIDLIDP